MVGERFVSGEASWTGEGGGVHILNLPCVGALADGFGDYFKGQFGR